VRRLRAYNRGPWIGSTGRLFGLYEKTLFEALEVRASVESIFSTSSATYSFIYTSAARLKGPQCVKAVGASGGWYV